MKSSARYSACCLGLLAVFGLAPGARAYQGTVLTDEELDGYSAGGFDFDIDAAYAYRAAVVHQSNIAALSSLARNRMNINSTNQTMVRSTDSPVCVNQQNFSFLFSKVGDIVDGTIRNLNVADVGSAALAAADNAADSLSAQPAAQVKQVNVAAVLAPNGKIDNVSVINANVINFSDQENTPVTNQTNITVLLAAGPIENSDVTSTNVSNSAAAAQGTEAALPVSLTQLLASSSKQAVTGAVQENIIFALSMAARHGAVDLKAINDRIRSLL